MRDEKRGWLAGLVWSGLGTQRGASCGHRIERGRDTVSLLYCYIDKETHQQTINSNTVQSRLRWQLQVEQQKSR